MPPKGIIEENETPREAASREVFEEIGIKISPSELGYDHFHIEYEKNGKVVKTITIFIYKINSLNEIKLESETVPKEQLQWENDDARFYNIDGVEKYCFWRYKNAIKRYI